MISTAKGLGVKVNVMLTGECVDQSATSLSTTTTVLSASVLSAREVFQRIANETGGLYLYRPGGTVNDYKEILTKIFESSLSTGGNNNTGAPVVTVSATPTVIWPPNHEWVYIDAHASATDDKDPNPVIKLVGVTLTDPPTRDGVYNPVPNFLMLPLSLNHTRNPADGVRYPVRLWGTRLILLFLDLFCSHTNR
ncbi:MAG: hypothetical protein PHD43_24065 [Methylococcales bacterium]|nr:hypothetical protein [Methylococcales bacterium]